MTVTSPVIDLNDVDVFAAGKHHEMFDWLRANDPVHWQPESVIPGFWSLTRYDDLVYAYREHTLFSSAGGVMLGGSFRNEVDTASGRMLVASDLPKQRLLRQVVHRAFAPHIVSRVDAQVHSLVDSAIERAVADGGCDFATDIAPELPAGALMALAGISHDEAHHLIGLTHGMIGFRDPALVETAGDERLRLAGIQADIFDFFADLIAERRKDPGDDLVGILLRAEINGRPMPEEDILYNCLNVAVGGNETTAYTACAGVIAMMENPVQHELLCRQPELLLDSALAEVLRMSSTNAYTHRVAKQDVEIRGRQIHAGDSIALWNVSANRDEAQFPDPHRFDITRGQNRHITFGTGIHRCVGAQLGQTELAALFGKLSRTTFRFELAGDISRLRSNFMLGVNHLPVRVAGKN